MNRFEGKTVLVTGGNSGMGLVTAQAYAAEGARVIITGRDEATLATAKETLGKSALAIRNDAGSTAAARELARQLADQGVRLDAVFINAGIPKFAPFTDVAESMWDQTFDINVKGPYFQLQALVPLFNRGASVVLNGSINAHIGMPGTSLYAATKAGLISLIRTLSGELIAKGIRVNAVSPGPISTPLYGKLGFSEAELKNVASSIQGQVPAGRFGTAAEVASMVVYFASDESAYVVGSEILMDGGMSNL